MNTGIEDTGDAEEAKPKAAVYTEDDFKKFVDISSLPAALIDGDLNCSYANQALCSFLGTDLDELREKKISRFIRIREPRPSANLMQRLASGQSNCGEWEFFRDDGSIALGDVMSTPLGDGTYIIFINDATGRKRAEAALRESERIHLQGQKIEALGRLAGGVAHDFNNLLGVILLHIDILNMQLPADSPVRTRIAEIQAVSNKAAGIVRQLLAFGRKELINPAPVVLNATLNVLEGQLRSTLGPDVELVMKPDADLGVCFVDQSQIGKIVISLAVNAKDAMPQGGKFTITTRNVNFDKGTSHRSQAGGSYVEISISDDGRGMDPKTLEHIFEPFFSTKESDKGAGLGLAMVYGLVKQSGGFIWVESEADRGTTFKIQFPRVDQPAAAEPQTTQPQSADKLPRANETVLLVEDEETVRKITAEILRTSGYEVIDTGSGLKALEVAQAHTRPIDLLITDFSMPGMNGLEVADKVVSMHPETAVLFMSGDIGNTIAQIKSPRKKTFFLAKPFSPSDLELKVREIFS